MEIAIVFAAVLVMFLAPLTFAEETETKAAPPYPIWPIPREAEYAKERLVLSDAVIVVPEGDERAQYPGRLLSEIIADEYMAAIPVVVGKAPEGKTPIIVGQASDKIVAAAAGKNVSPTSPGPEGYYLKVDDNGAVIAGCDYRGTLYGVSSFAQLVHKWAKKSVAVRQATVRDWPFLPIRWVHVYIPGREQLPFFRRYMRDFLLRYKFNGMILEVGAGMRLDSHPEINTGWERTVKEWYGYGESIWKFNEGCPLGPANRFMDSCHPGVGGGYCVEKQDVKEFAAAAERFGLEIVPEVQSLSHVYYIACARRDVAEEPDADWPDSYCPSNPESYKVLFDIMDEYIDVLKPKRVHIGHDEYRSGVFCPRCRGKDSGRLYAEDVIKICKHLKSKGIETWMWGDHFVDWHNRFGRAWSEGTIVKYEKPDTASARDIVAAEIKDLKICNWSGERGDETFRKLGWQFIVGNFRGTGEKDWPGRAKRSSGSFLGGETSSWCAMDEFQLGKLHFAEAAYTINLMWSSSYPERDVAFEELGLLMPKVHSMLAPSTPPSAEAAPMRFEVLDIQSACNSAPKTDVWNLSGVTPGDGHYNDIPFKIIDPNVNCGRSVVYVGRRPCGEPGEIALPVSGKWAALVFIHAASGEGRPTIHAGDQTQVPHESSELIGFYEIRYADGLATAHEIRYDENIGPWNSGLDLPLYFARQIVRGTLPDGRKAVLWASEWKNPRPDAPIASVVMKGAPGPTDARPILFAVTAIEKPRVEDYR